MYYSDIYQITAIYEKRARSKRTRPLFQLLLHFFPMEARNQILFTDSIKLCPFKKCMTTPSPLCDEQQV